MTALALRQGTPEWLAGRRALITATDIPVLLGLSPYRCEADLADEKAGGAPQETNVRMRIGSALEPLIAEEYERETGRRTRRFRTMVVHPELAWAAASPDAAVVGERRLVEFKWTASRTRFADGIPQDIEAQVAWQLGCSGYPVADIAVLAGDTLTVAEQPADPALFADLVAVAEDFRRRLAAGGPFARDDARIRREFPVDNGTYLPATPDLVELVDQFRAAKAAKAAAEDAEKTLASALRAVLMDASGIDGLLTYRKNADSTRTNWPAVAKAYREVLSDLAPEPVVRAYLERRGLDLDAIESVHSETSQGPRVLRLLKGD